MLRRNITDTTGSVQYSGGSNQAWSLRRVKLSKTKALAFRGTLFFRKLPTTKALPSRGSLIFLRERTQHTTKHERLLRTQGPGVLNYGHYTRSLEDHYASRAKYITGASKPCRGGRLQQNGTRFHLSTCR